MGIKATLALINVAGSHSVSSRNKLTIQYIVVSGQPFMHHVRDGQARVEPFGAIQRVTAAST